MANLNLRNTLIAIIGVVIFVSIIAYHLYDTYFQPHPSIPSASLNVAFTTTQICNGEEAQLRISAHNTDKNTTLSLSATMTAEQPTGNIVNFYYGNRPVTSIDLGKVMPDETTATKIISVNGTSPIQRSTVKININLKNNGQVLDSKSFGFTVENC